MLGLSDQCLGVHGEEDFLRNTAILHCSPQNYLPFGWGVMKFIISRVLPLMMLHTNLVKIGPVVSEEKMLTHDALRTTDDDGRQPIAKGHLSDSGDLKN